MVCWFAGFGIAEEPGREEISSPLVSDGSSLSSTAFCIFNTVTKANFAQCLVITIKADEVRSTHNPDDYPYAFNI